MRGVAKILFVLFFVGHGYVASANDSACEGCSASQMSSRALALGAGEHRIYSLSTGVMRGYTVSCGDIPQGGGSETSQSVESASLGESQHSSSDTQSALDEGDESISAGPCPMGKPAQVAGSPLSAQTTSAWALVLDFYRKNGRVDRVDVNINADIPGTAPYTDSVYPMLSDYQMRTDLFDLIFDQNQKLKDYAAAIVAAVLAHLNILPNQLLIGVVFRDGSSIVLKYDAATRQLSAVPNTARLANGQNVVERNNEDYQGDYRIVDLGDQEAYFRYLERMRIPVTRVPGRTGYKLSCAFNGEKLTCKVQYISG